MSRTKILTAVFLVALLPGAAKDAAASAKCGGRFFNPVSDVDWRAMFSIKIGGVAVTPGEGTDTASHFPLCFCGSPVPRVGIKVSFWEPVKLIEVVRHPGCFPSLGGRKLPLPSFATGGGAYGEGGGQRGKIETDGRKTAGNLGAGRDEIFEGRESLQRSTEGVRKRLDNARSESVSREQGMSEIRKSIESSRAQQEKDDGSG